MFCGNCGKEIENSASTCKWCRASVEEDKTVKNNVVIPAGLLGAEAYWLGE